MIVKGLGALVVLLGLAMLIFAGMATEQQCVAMK